MEREPLFWPSHMNIGDTLRMTGDTAGAIREQEKILEQSPDNVFALPHHGALDSGERGPGAPGAGARPPPGWSSASMP